MVLYVCNIQTTFAKAGETLEPIKQVRITYLTVDGYATYRHVARYMRHNDTFVLKKKGNNRNIPETISGNYVFDFAHVLICDTVDICEKIKVSQEDFNILQSIIFDKERCLRDYFYFKEECYTERIKNINISSFQALTCQDIIRIINDRSNPLYSPVYPMKIELICDNGRNLSVYPKWGYKGLPWMFSLKKKEKAVAYEKILDFINKIGFAQFVFFKDRDELMLQIACGMVL